jgi:hypothetical protein
MIQHENRQHLAEAQPARSAAVDAAVLQLSPVPRRLDRDGELVQVVEEWNNVHGGLLASKPLSFRWTAEFVGQERPPFLWDAYYYSATSLFSGQKMGLN